MTIPDQERKLPKPVNPETEPIINSPYREPEWHWQLNSQAKAISPALPGRRIAQDVSPVAGSKNVQGTEMAGFGAEWPPLELVNRIRELVQEWVGQDYPGVTSTTKRLIGHWTADEDQDEYAYRFYYAQLDAVLTHIYLIEVPPTEIVHELEDVNGKRNDGICRLAHKMATGTGKTVAMAMLIAWQVTNHHANPNDERFVRRFLLVTPGLTVKERLESSLNPNSPNNDYTEFGILPPGDDWEQALSLAQVSITNYHQFEARTVAENPSRVADDLLSGGAKPPTPEERQDRRETPAEIVQRVTDSKSNPYGQVMVINDESHHCHRGNPSGLPENTVWFTGLTYLRDAGLLQHVADMSATPIYIAQSNPSPVEWIVSDYSLVDAIEAGLVKIPQVPTATGSGQLPKYRDLYNETDPQQRRSFNLADQANNALIKEALSALCEEHATMTHDWEQMHSARQAQRDPDDEPEPLEMPVIAIVMDNISHANAMFEYISTGAANAPLLCNYTHAGGTELLPEPRTIIVHSQMEEGRELSQSVSRFIRPLAEVYRANPKYGFTDRDRPGEIIRRVMNTVGRPRQPGESVRCVISVAMLTEGWDAKTVTHMLGFRAFGSSLLCEQVAGRTLRRVTRDYDHTGQRFTAEYARILGIPFPQYEQPSTPGPCPKCGQEPCQCPPVPTIEIRLKLDRPDLQVDWPNITRLQRARNADAITLSPLAENLVDNHVVGDPNADTTILEGQVGPELEIQGPDAFSNNHFLFQVAAQATRNIITDLENTAEADRDDSQHYTVKANRLFSQSLSIAQLYSRNGKLRGPGERSNWPGQGPAIAQTAQWLQRNIHVAKPSNGNSPIMRAVGTTRQPWLTTDTFRSYRASFDPQLIYGPTQKSPITHAHCDSNWEVQVAQHLDELPEIVRWVRNHRLNWAIPYVVDGEQHRYLPDFIAVAPLDNGTELNIVIEVKGQERPHDPDKRRWAGQYWVPAVNRHDEYGYANNKVWDYLYLDNYPLIQGAKDAITALINKHKQSAGTA